MAVNMGVIWFIALIVFLVLEGSTYQLISVYFAIGAVGGLISHMLGAEAWGQVIVFFAVSVLSLALLRPVSMKLLKNKGTKTNAESLIGARVYITKEVDNIKESGEGKVNGIYWTVRSLDDSVIPKDSVATIERIEGVKLIVKES